MYCPVIGWKTDGFGLERRDESRVHPNVRRFSFLTETSAKCPPEWFEAILVETDWCDWTATATGSCRGCARATPRPDFPIPSVRFPIEPARDEALGLSTQRVAVSVPNARRRANFDSSGQALDSADTVCSARKHSRDDVLG